MVIPCRACAVGWIVTVGDYNVTEAYRDYPQDLLTFRFDSFYKKKMLIDILWLVANSIRTFKSNLE